MFEVGKTYRITMQDGDYESYSSYTIEAVEMPLIKVSQSESSTIINTSSRAFIKAELQDLAAMKAAENAWLDNASDDDKAL